MIKFFIKTFGCKVNQYDSQLIKENLIIDKNFIPVTDYKNADLIIINSCIVTEKAEEEVLKYAKKFKNYGVVIITGCFKENKKLEGVYYLPLKDEIDIKNFIYEILNMEKEKSKTKQTISFFEDRTRAFLKIEEGCNKFCSYCIVPYLRGSARSKDIDVIKEEFLNLLKNGYKEIVLSGTELGFYGIDINKNLIKLLQELLSYPYDFRIRLSSIDPEFLSDELIQFFCQNEKLCPHIHLPLQSGSNKILNLMRRRYDKNYYLDRAFKFKESVKNSTITTDIIVGFPDENEDDFYETIDVIKKVEFLKCHIFPYSEREGTFASKYLRDKKLNEEIIKERIKIIKKIAKEVSNKVLNRFVNKELVFLGETKKEDKLFGFTENYIRVFIDKEFEKNKFYKIYLQNSKNFVEYGIVISEFYYGVPIEKEVRTNNASSI
ncbi:MAG: tRNA (N(6)-L-threonylcarbamoyladenosine(37)-C(2))-methylthiotransferase MtaB [Caldisericia bacterium]|jgi:threonylcarbamoyladenosine tRNA methylthiotransferase MtaB|nr:tRNA (N(6)-L-threonylcarbamoyladenosine(37)-C(2))-methylthiotransferase MtaB [Caldisericia bacterium]